MLAGENRILLGDNLEVLPAFDDGCFQLVYADPPFNTGRRQRRLTLATEASPDGERTGFGGRRYTSHVLAESSFADSFDDYVGFLEPRVQELHRLLAEAHQLAPHLHLNGAFRMGVSSVLAELRKAVAAAGGPRMVLHEAVHLLDEALEGGSKAWPQILK